jgi:hypothetical protein
VVVCAGLCCQNEAGEIETQQNSMKFTTAQKTTQKIACPSKNEKPWSFSIAERNGQKKQLAIRK